MTAHAAGRLHVTQSGRGPAVVLVHGQPGSSEDWATVSAALSGSCTVIRYDRPGWGGSAGPARGIAANADALEGLLRSESRSRVAVVGYSFGAAVAVALAERAPDVVAGLVLICPALSPRSLTLVDSMLALPVVGESLTLGGFVIGGRLLSALERHAGRLGRSLSSRLQLLAQAGLGVTLSSGPRPWASFAIEQRALLSEIPAVERAMGTITAPIALVAGLRDRVVTPSSIRALAPQLPSATIDWLPGGHLLPWTSPDVVAWHIAAAVARWELD